MSEPRIVETVDPEEAFSILSDPTRIGILQALWEVDGHEATFSELRERVGTSDSGKFNYHLGKVTGQFVAKTDEGYELTVAGMQVVGALLAGAYTMEGSSESVPIEDGCPSCGGPMTFQYEDELARIDCDDCRLEARFPVPPVAFAGGTSEPLPRTADRYFRAALDQAKNGICPYCEGRTEPSVVPYEEHSSRETAEHDGSPAAVYRCSRCDETVEVDLGSALVDHPAVVSFFYERGTDVRELPFWRVVAVDAERSRTRGRDPLRASVTYAADGDELTITVDRSLTPVDVDEPTS